MRLPISQLRYSTIYPTRLLARRAFSPDVLKFAVGSGEQTYVLVHGEASIQIIYLLHHCQRDSAVRIILGNRETAAGGVGVGHVRGSFPIDQSQTAFPPSTIP